MGMDPPILQENFDALLLIAPLHVRSFAVWLCSGPLCSVFSSSARVCADVRYRHDLVLLAKSSDV